jgi:hypothetical protein
MTQKTIEIIGKIDKLDFIKIYSFCFLAAKEVRGCLLHHTFPL